jgi:hypothetical protein
MSNDARSMAATGDSSGLGSAFAMVRRRTIAA